MPQIRFTRNLTRFFPALGDCEVPGQTVSEVLAALDQVYPGLAAYLIDEKGGLRQHVNVFLNDRPVRDRERLSDLVLPDSRLFIVQALSGG